jgi:hypothetical protein
MRLKILRWLSEPKALIRELQDFGRNTDAGT